MAIRVPSKILSPGITSAIVLFWIVSAALLYFIFSFTGGHFSYTLDDPYIHLAMAEALAVGHYGINQGEITAPSSSVIWPFLFVPGVGTTWHEYLPLIFNLIFGTLAAGLLGAIVMRLPWGQRAPRALLIPAIALSCLLVIDANLPGLTFNGMEHTLQVLLAIAAAYGVIEVYNGRQMPIWSIAAAIIAPSIRYECLTITLAVAAALFGQRRYLLSFSVVGASLVLPAAFSAFLISSGLPPLPNSVLAKTIGSSNGSTSSSSFLHVADAAFQKIGLGRGQMAWKVNIGLALALLITLLSAKSWPHRWLLLGSVGAIILHICFGQTGWFYRYEVYVLIFSLLVLMGIYGRHVTKYWYLMIPVLVVIGSPYAKCIYLTPRAAQNIYEQQYQMARFVQDYHRKPFAVNDLGWVSYRLPNETEVLDLWGLASNEALQQKVKSAAWLDQITQQHNVGLAVIYPGWFPDIPADWTPIALMQLSGERITPAENKVLFLSTGVGNPEEIRKELEEFAPTLPPGVTLKFQN